MVISRLPGREIWSPVSYTSLPFLQLQRKVHLTTISILYFSIQRRRCADQDTNWENPTDEDPKPEDCKCGGFLFSAMNTRMSIFFASCNAPKTNYMLTPPFCFFLTCSFFFSYPIILYTNKNQTSKRPTLSKSRRLLSPMRHPLRRTRGRTLGTELRHTTQPLRPANVTKYTGCISGGQYNRSGSVSDHAS